MNEYPRLSDMGVLHPNHIVRYSVSSFNNHDYLTIGYSRPKGSLLPVTRTYSFPRVQRTVQAKDGASDDYDVLDTNPDFLEAEAELKQIVDSRASKEGAVEALHEELRHLEEEFACHTSTLRAMIDELKDK